MNDCDCLNGTNDIYHFTWYYLINILKECKKYTTLQPFCCTFSAFLGISWLILEQKWVYIPSWCQRMLKILEEADNNTSKWSRNE